jgi:hypothetical protein
MSTNPGFSAPLYGQYTAIPVSITATARNCTPYANATIAGRFDVQCSSIVPNRSRLADLATQYLLKNNSYCVSTGTHRFIQEDDTTIYNL